MLWLEDKWFYLLLAVIVTILVLAVRESNINKPQRVLVDVEVQEVADPYLRHDMQERFIGVQEFRIIFYATEKED